MSVIHYSDLKDPNFERKRRSQNLYECQIVGTGRFGYMGKFFAYSFEGAAKKAVKKRYVEGDKKPPTRGPSVEVTRGDETRIFNFKNEITL